MPLSPCSVVRPHERGVFRDLDDNHVLLVYSSTGKRLARVELAEGVDVERSIQRLWDFLALEDSAPALRLIG